ADVAAPEQDQLARCGLRGEAAGALRPCRDLLDRAESGAAVADRGARLRGAPGHEVRAPRRARVRAGDGAAVLRDVRAVVRTRRLLGHAELRAGHVERTLA